MRGGNFSCSKEQSQWAFRRFGDERDRHFSANKLMVIVFLWVNIRTGEIIATLHEFWAAKIVVNWKGSRTPYFREI